ncbi:hypothetical protein D9M72_618830 [compost metagenome]
MPEAVAGNWVVAAFGFRQGVVVDLRVGDFSACGVAFALGLEGVGPAFDFLLFFHDGVPFPVPLGWRVGCPA